ncbi:hypothetical protein NPIL_531831, partial [Nephila pilipes]
CCASFSYVLWTNDTWAGTYSPSIPKISFSHKLMGEVSVDQFLTGPISLVGSGFEPPLENQGLQNQYPEL